jgi:predicted nicotinamide N-methyase
MNIVQDRQAFIRSHTSVLSPPLVPEVSLHLAHEALPIWQKTEEDLGEIGLPPPFWAFAWAGGQALARYILDNRAVVAGRSVIDLASGSGIVAIAAIKAGASSVLAADIDSFSIAAIGINAKINGVSVDATLRDLLAADPLPADVVLVGDLFYEKSLAARCLGWLRLAESRGARVLIGDPGRTYLPKDELEKVAEYSVPVSRDLEDAEIKRAAVWRLAGSC